jgi:hypothetical protein
VKTKGQMQKIGPQFTQNKFMQQCLTSFAYPSKLKLPMGMESSPTCKLLSKHPNHKLQICCQSIVEFEFDEIQIAKAPFVLNKTNNLDHGNLYQLQIF